MKNCYITVVKLSETLIIAHLWAITIKKAQIKRRLTTFILAAQWKADVQLIYLQIKDQVMEAFLRDAVMESYY